VILQPRHFPFLGRKEGKKMFLKQSDVKVQTGLKWVMTGSSGRFLITWIPSPSELISVALGGKKELAKQ
jgi:hypothetical protein